MFGHGNKTFSGRTGFATGLLLDLIDIQAASHKDVVDVLSVELEVVGTSKAQIGDRRARIRVHALSKALQGLLIEETQHRKQVATSPPQGACRKVFAVLCKAR